MENVCIPGEKWASVNLDYALHASVRSFRIVYLTKSILNTTFHSLAAVYLMKPCIDNSALVYFGVQSAGTMKMTSTVTKPDIDAFAGRSPQDGSQWFQFDQNEEAVGYFLVRIHCQL